MSAPDLTRGRSQSSGEQRGSPADVTPPDAGRTRGAGADDAVPPTSPPAKGRFGIDLLKGLLGRLGLDPLTMKMMFKGSLPPIIATSIYQAEPISSFFSTTGYEVAIIAVLAIAILPRGKYLQTLLLNLIAVLLGSAVAMLLLWTGVQARLHTATPDSQSSPGGVVPYNSSQSAVCGIWLFAGIWVVNLVRARAPSFNVPAIVFSILVNIAATSGTTLTSTTAAWEQIVRRLLLGMLLALGIATGVSLVVFPLSSRVVVITQLGKAVGLLRKAAKLQGEYLHGLERGDMFVLRLVETCVSSGFDRKKKGGKKRGKGRKAEKCEGDAEGEEDETALELKGAIIQMRDLFGKIQGDIAFAKREVAWGKLDAHDLNQAFKLMRAVFISVMGMATIMDIFRRTAKDRGWTTIQGKSTPLDVLSEKCAERQMWNGIMQQLHEPFAALSGAIDGGLEHAAIQLGFLPRPKGSIGPSSPGSRATTNGPDKDVEAHGDEPAKPGESKFGVMIEEKIREFCAQKDDILRYWEKRSRAQLAELTSGGTISAAARQRSQVQLNVLLYMEQLMHATGEAVHDLVLFADSKVADGTMSSARLLTPGARRMRKWASSVFGIGRNKNSAADSTAEEAPDVLERGGSIVHMGDGFCRRRRDPEHLPPVGFWEKMGDRVRAVSGVLGSEESGFGLRAACATMTIGIVAFLERTQAFFQQQRLVWAMIIIAIGMTPTSGQTIFGFFCRIGGTLIAMISSFIIWYVVDQRTPGVIVLLWLFIMVEYYFFVKYPRFIPATMLVIVTQVLIIGYELQVGVIGVAASERAGQPYYPTYLLAPYRVATVAVGCFVAFFWTVFPSPSSDRTCLRRDLSASLYLLAKYFSAILQTFKVVSELDREAATIARTKTGELRRSGKHAHHHHLDKARHRFFGKLMLLLPSLETHSQWQKWEPTIGGRFPKATYNEILLRSSRILNYLTLMSYTASRPPRITTSTTSTAQAAEDNARWLQALQVLLQEVRPAHGNILSTLALLSNCLLSGQSLPPYIQLPQPYELTQRALSLLPTPPIGASSGINEATPGSSSSENNGNIDYTSWGYTEFAVLQVCSALVRDDLLGLVKAVERLVGVVDFSFRVDMSPTNASSPAPSPSSTASSSQSSLSADSIVDDAPSSSVATGTYSIRMTPSLQRQQSGVDKGKGKAE